MASRVLLRKSDVLAKTGLSESRLYVLMDDEDEAKAFPRPVRIGSRAVAWVQSEIDEWIHDRISERNSGKAKAPWKSCGGHATHPRGISMADIPKG